MATAANSHTGKPRTPLPRLAVPDAAAIRTETLPAPAAESGLSKRELITGSMGMTIPIPSAATHMRCSASGPQRCSHRLASHAAHANSATSQLALTTYAAKAHARLSILPSCVALLFRRQGRNLLGIELLCLDQIHHQGF